MVRGLADRADEQRWRHLDTMHFTTELTARFPRSRRKEHGVETIAPPWAGTHFRFALLIEDFGVAVRQTCRTVKAAVALLGVSRDPVKTVTDRAVVRGLRCREAKPTKHIGIDSPS